MAKPYYLSQRNGIWYVSFYDEDTKKTTSRKSTGQTSKKAAEQVAKDWLTSGERTEDRRLKESENEKMDFVSLYGKIATFDLSEKEFQKIQELFKHKKLLNSYVQANTPSSEKFTDFVRRFWDWERSPYIQEKQLYKHSIHRYYVKRNYGYVDKHFVPYFKDKTVGEITRQDIKGLMMYLNDLQLSGESINQITRCVTTPLRWAFQNGLTENNCFDGITFVAVKHKKREVLTMEQAAAIFDPRVEWISEYSRLANLTAMCTGMRAGEIQALMIQDIGIDRIYVRHSWERGSYGGLKTPKNGEEREIPIPAELRDLLLEQGRKNPFGEGIKGFIFFGLVPGQPMDSKPWLTALRDALSQIGYDDPKKIVFHAWRHLYSARMADYIDQRKLQRATGHKTAAMLEHYADHAKEEDFIDLRNTATSLFLPIINETDRENLED